MIPSLDALSDDVIVIILRQAWAARPRRPASAEVRLACGLQNVCRRVRSLIRQDVLLALDLDFTKEFVSLKQGLWLLGRKGHPGCTIHAARFCWGDPFWGGKTAQIFLALHGHSLKALSVPFRLVGEPDDWPSPCKVARLNLSATQLESISILATDKYYDRVLGLLPELLPRTLKHVTVRSFTTRDTADSVLGLQYLLDNAARLPALRSLSVTCRDFAVEEQLKLYANDYPAGICQSVRFRGKVVVDAGATTCMCLSQARTVFEAAASLHIKSDSIVLECADDALSTLARMLCPDSLQDCVLRGAAGIRFVYGSNADQEIPIWDVIRMLLVQRSSAFAFACGTDAKGRTCLRWSRWPARGSVAWYQAAAAHMATMLVARQTLSPTPPSPGVGQPAEDDDGQSDALSWLASDTESEELFGVGGNGVMGQQQRLSYLAQALRRM